MKCGNIVRYIDETFIFIRYYDGHFSVVVRDRHSNEKIIMTKELTKIFN